jgi:hypothetical protein
MAKHECCWVMASSKPYAKKTNYKIVPDPDSGGKMRKYSAFCEEHAPLSAQENEEEFWDEPQYKETNMRSSVVDNTMDAICEPADKVDVFISSDKKNLYVHVNGVTVFRLGHIPNLVLDIPTTMITVKK